MGDERIERLEALARRCWPEEDQLVVEHVAGALAQVITTGGSTLAMVFNHHRAAAALEAALCVLACEAEPEPDAPWTWQQQCYVEVNANDALIERAEKAEAELRQLEHAYCIEGDYVGDEHPVAQRMRAMSSALAKLSAELAALMAGVERLADEWDVNHFTRPYGLQLRELLKRGGEHG